MQPSQFSAHVTQNRQLTGGYFALELEPAAVANMQAVRPGQFVMLRGEWGNDLLNPRAFSVLKTSDGHFSVLLKVFGRGTARMAALRAGDRMVVTGPLGTGFVSPAHGATQLLVAGGVGLPPLYLQAKVATETVGAAAVEMFYGGRTSDELVLVDDFERWKVITRLTTNDGSRGERGLVTAPLQRRLDEASDEVSILACGPTPMLRAVREIGLARGIPTYLCVEEEMACGFGVCLGCAVPVYGANPYRYCCTDGPVFDAREVRWS